MGMCLFRLHLQSSYNYRNGSRLTGLLIVALNLYQRARIEQEVDIVLELKLARRSRPQFIPDYVSALLLQFSSYIMN